MRNTFAKALIDLARKDKTIFLLTGDLGYSVLEPFVIEFPDRFLNVGVAEQNMTVVASGLAKEGYNVFTYSIGNFPTLICREQIRYDICYHNLNVKIIAVGAGYAYGLLGVSHHTTEDLGMFRAIPNLTVASPSDPLEVTALTKLFVMHQGRCYMRLNKTGEMHLHESVPHLLENEPLRILQGKEKLILGTGAIVKDAFIAAREKGWELWRFPILSPMGTKWITDDLLRFKEIMTIEEHQLNSGFGSAIHENINDAFVSQKMSKFPIIRRLGIPKIFLGFSGSQEYLRTQAKLSILI